MSLILPSSAIAVLESASNAETTPCCKGVTWKGYLWWTPQGSTLFADLAGKAIHERSLRDRRQPDPPTATYVHFRRCLPAAGASARSSAGCSSSEGALAIVLAAQLKGDLLPSRSPSTFSVLNQSSRSFPSSSGMSSFEASLSLSFQQTELAISRGSADSGGMLRLLGRWTRWHSRRQG